jgi:chromosome segregation ATPase
LKAKARLITTDFEGDQVATEMASALRVFIAHEIEDGQDQAAAMNDRITAIAQRTTATEADTAALYEKLRRQADAIEELNRRTFELKAEAERRALITAGLETRLEKAEQAIRTSQDKRARKTGDQA